MHYSLASCQLYFLVPLSSFLAHLLAISHMSYRNSFIVTFSVQCMCTKKCETNFILQLWAQKMWNQFHTPKSVTDAYAILLNLLHFFTVTYGRHSSKMTYTTFKLAAKTYFQVSKVKMDSGFEWWNSENLGVKRKNEHYFLYRSPRTTHAVGTWKYGGSK